MGNFILNMISNVHIIRFSGGIIMKILVFTAIFFPLFSFSYLATAAQDHNSTRSNRGSLHSEDDEAGNYRMKPEYRKNIGPESRGERKGRNPQTGKEINIAAPKD